MNLHFFQHVPFEGLGSIEDWVQDNNFDITCTRFFDGEHPPATTKYDWLFIMGGPMNIYEEDKYPWLKEEKKAIKTAISKGKIVVGICLGAQLIADTLGAKIVANQHKEIGWFKIHKHPQAHTSPLADFLPEECWALHWHGDTFVIPQGAIPLASSEACANQGFIYNERVVALQFHLEFTQEAARLLIENAGHELVEAPFIQSADRMLKCDQRFFEINYIMDNLLLALLNKK